MKIPDFCGSDFNFSIVKNYIRSEMNSSLSKKFCLYYMKIDFCCGGDTSFVHRT